MIRQLENLLMFGGIAGVVYGIGSYFVHISGNLPSDFYKQFCFGDGPELSNSAMISTIFGACLKSFRKNGYHR